MEHRKAQRYDLRLPVTLVRHGRRSVSGSGETKNLSSKGVLFRSDAHLQIGEPVEYVITLPQPSGSKGLARLYCMGKIVRCSTDKEVAATVDRYEFVRAPLAG